MWLVGGTAALYIPLGAPAVQLLLQFQLQTQYNNPGPPGPPSCPPLTPARRCPSHAATRLGGDRAACLPTLALAPAAPARQYPPARQPPSPSNVLAVSETYTEAAAGMTLPPAPLLPGPAPQPYHPLHTCTASTTVHALLMYSSPSTGCRLLAPAAMRYCVSTSRMDSAITLASMAARPTCGLGRMR